MVTFDGGTTGSVPADSSDYYSRFDIYVDGVLQTPMVLLLAVVMMALLAVLTQAITSIVLVVRLTSTTTTSVV